jgi:hypothetical protein
VWAFAKNYQPLGNLLINIAVSKKQSYSPDVVTPPANTLPQPTTHFERNEAQGI